VGSGGGDRRQYLQQQLLLADKEGRLVGGHDGRVDLKLKRRALEPDKADARAGFLVNVFGLPQEILHVGKHALNLGRRRVPAKGQQLIKQETVAQGEVFRADLRNL
jgi:hypothetical protein